jgi:hypothetical protein
MVEEEKDLVMCKICGREFESEELLKKHSPMCFQSSDLFFISKREKNLKKRIIININT